MTINAPAAILLAIIVLSATTLYLYTWETKPVYLQAGKLNFPMSIAGFQGNPIEEWGDPFYSGIADNEIIARYKGPKGEIAIVYVGYFHSQNQERELIDYRYNWLHDGAKIIEISTSPEIRMKKNSVKNVINQ